MIARRDLLRVAAGAAVARVGFAQPTIPPRRVGLLAFGSEHTTGAAIDALRSALAGLGWDEGHNIEYQIRWAEGRPEKLPALAADLVRLRVDVIVASVDSTVAAAQRATTTIPIVMVGPSDPVAAGFVASLARPGGNITGLSVSANVETRAKRLELLKQAVPDLSRVAVLTQVFPLAGGRADSEALVAMASRLGIALELHNIQAAGDVDEAIAAIGRRRTGGLLVEGNVLTLMRRQQIAEFALEHRLPAVGTAAELARAGLLMTYGAHAAALNRQAAAVIDKVLRGARPSDLPVEQPTKFELVINLRTANALGLTIQPSLRLRADEVIE
jgi:putative ABC transport system substrate-binding protein